MHVLNAQGLYVLLAIIHSFIIMGSTEKYEIIYKG